MIKWVRPVLSLCLTDDCFMFRPSRRLIFVCLAGLFVLWAGSAALGLFGQHKLFYEEGSEELYDFWMPRMCLEQGYVGHPEQYEGFVDVRKGKPIVVDDRDVVWSDWYTDGSEKLFITGWRDKVYPKIALLPVAPFPATRVGGYLWSALAGVIFLASLCLVGRSWKPILLALSMPFIFNFERGNPVWLSAACVGIFLAWWDDECEWKSMVAAGCLAVAAALKIVPGVLGIIYFTKWRRKPVLFSGAFAAALVFVPWFFDRDGFAALGAMVRNASEHSEFVLRASDFGLIELWRTARVVLGLDVTSPWPGMMVVARLSQLFGLVALIFGAKRRDYLLLVGGMMLLAGNMYYYAMLYVLPALVIDLFSRGEGGEGEEFSRVERVDRVEGEERKWWIWIELGLWLALLSPLQVVVLGHSANQVIGNVALMGLMGIRLVCGGNCLAATTFAEATVVKENAKDAKI